MRVQSSFLALLSKAGRDETPKDRLGLDLQSVVLQGGVDFSVSKRAIASTQQGDVQRRLALEFGVSG